MKKQIIFYVMCLLPMIATADAVKIDGIYYNLISKLKTAEVTSNPSRYTGFVNIPDSVTYEGVVYMVKSIGNSAFYNCTNLHAVTIPNSVTSIGDYAFRRAGLNYIIIPNSVTSIGNTAFGSCTSLTSVTIPNSVTSIGDSAFNGCTGLTSITIPNSVTSIGDSAFNGCTGLTSVNIPSSVTRIGKYAFSGCSRLTSVTIPNSVTIIGDSAFSGCSRLTSVTIPNSVTSIGDSAFSGCSRLTSVTIPNSVTSIGGSAFSGCTSLTTVTIPSSVTIILGSAFYGCSSLTSINIPDNVTQINYQTFKGCSNLTSITIPENVTYIDETAFLGCSSLANVKVPVTDYGTFCNSIICSWIYTAIGQPVHLIDKAGNEITEYTIPDYVTSIGDYAFCRCTGLTSITIPENVTSIGAGAFWGCTALKNIKVPEGVTSIGGHAFNGCISLTSVNIPNSVTYIGDGAFYGCISLTSVNISNNVTSIGASVFAGCTHLTSITIPNSVTSIGSSAFGRTGLTSIIIPNSVTSIGSNAFHDCSSLTSIIIPNSLVSIDNGAFKGCPELTDVYCYAKKVPTTSSDTFEGSLIEYATLHVSNSAIDLYRTTDPWNNFGNIVPITDYKIVYVIDGEEFKIVEYGVGDVITPEPTPTKEGYTFSGWSEIPETMPAHDVIVTGYFIMNSGNCSLTYILDGIAHTQSIPCNTPLKEKLEEIVREQYAEIPLIKEASQLSSPCTDLIEGTDLGALLDRDPTTFWHSDWHKVYNIGLHYFQVEMKEEYSGVYNSIIFEFTRRNCPKDHITEWSVRGTNFDNAEMEECEELIYAYTPHTSDTETITSEPFAYKGYKYLRFYCLNSHPVYHTFFHLSEFQLHPYQTTPIKKGHTFTGWTLENGEQIPKTMPNYDITVLASFVANKYKLIYQVDGEEYRTYEVEYGATITPEATPTKEGYTFIGWSEIPETMPAHDVIITGVFTKTLEQCATPTISYANGKLKYECKTPGVEFVTEITDDDIKNHTGDEVSLTATYIIKVIAKADGYDDSEVATATLCWIDAKPIQEGTIEAEDGVTEVKVIPVLIQAGGNTITVQGAAEGTEISVYSTAGIKLCSTIANNGITRLNTQLPLGSTAIVKIGEKAVKVLVK
ncbi:MAG: leucine-rich repeat protein [Bacteroidaceae bacterium]|nr:leucine-rich repeat protein [Bacteroidaceae bacterium]